MRSGVQGMAISDVYRTFSPNKTTFAIYTVNATVYKTKLIIAGLWHGKLS